MRYAYSKSAIAKLKKIQTTFINLTTAVILAITSISGAAPLFLSQTAHAASNNVVTAGHTLGWAFTTTGDATSQYTTDPSVQVSGSGSYELRSDSGKKGYLYDSSYASRDLTSLKHLSYSYYVANRNVGTSVAPALSLITTINGTPTELKVEPTYTNGAPAGSWQTIDAFAPTTEWYSTHDLQDVHGNIIVHKFNGVADLVSWDTLVSLDHSAKLGTDDGANGVRFTIGQNSGGAPWSNFDAYIDNVNINDNVYDFEPTIVPSVNAENFNTNSDSNYKGINVGFNISDFKTVSKVAVSLYKDTTSTTPLVTNTQNQNLLDLINKSGVKELSTPFIIQDGSYHEDYWNLGAYNWTLADKPAKATITVTGTDAAGNVVTKTAENDNFVETDDWTGLFPTHSSGAPTITGFTQGTNTLACGVSTNTKGGNINWTAPSGNFHQFAITPSYPNNQGEYTYYPSGASTSVWIGDNFGNHGDGLYSYTMQAQNTAGQWSAVSSPCTLTYDTTPPTVTVTPVAGNLLHGTETFHITINDANPASSANKSVWVYLYDTAGTQKGWGTKVDLSSGQGTFTIDTTKLDDGNANLDVGLVKDAAGNPTADAYHPNGTDSYFINYIIDNTAPAVPTNLSWLDSNNNPATNGFTNVQKGTLSWQDSTPTDVNHYVYKFWTNIPGYHDGYTNAWTTDDSQYFNGASIWTDFDNYEGTYYFCVEAVDVAGNTSACSDTYSITYDKTAPVVSNIQIVPTINGNIGRTVTVTFDLTDTSGIDTSKTRVLFSDGPSDSHHKNESPALHPQLVPGSSNTYRVVFDTTQFVYPNYTGHYNLSFNPYDILGNHTSTKPVDFRGILIDNSGPSSTLTTPVNGSIINRTERFTFTTSDDTGVLSGYVKFNGPTTKQYNLTRGTGDEWYADVDTTQLNNGTYTLDARFIDSFGTPRYSANKGSVTVDNDAPDVAITAPIDGTTLSFKHDGVVDVRGNVTDVHPDHYYWKVTGPNGYSISKTVHDTNSFTNQSLFPWNLQGLASGTYTIDLEARDAAGGTISSGNKDASSVETISVTVDNTAPTLTIDAYNGTDTTPTITGTTTDATDVVTVDGNGATVSSTVNGSGTYDWSYTPTTAFSLGTTTVTVVSTDLLGNAFQKTADITVTATATPGITPTVTVTPHTDGHVLGDSTTTPNLALATNNTKSNDKSNGNVQGDQTSNSNNSKDKTITSSNDFLGLGWWWLLILAVILGFFWFLLGKRTDTDDKEV